MGTEIERILDNCYDDMVAFARKLISLPSVTGEESEVAAAIMTEMKRLGYDEVMTDSTGNVIGVIKGSGGGEHIMYNCHMDHVSPGDLDAWQFPPYDAVIDGGFIHGRGASDTKGAIAVQVYAAAAVKKSGAAHKGDIIVTMVVEEEPGDMWGMRQLYDEVFLKYPGKIGLLVLGEATGLNVYLGHRGKVEIELRVQGKIAHSSAPWRGVNAVYLMQPVIKEIAELCDKLPKHDFLTDSSITITNITCSPGWLSTVPDRCAVTVDRRFLPHENMETITNEMEGLLKRGGLTPGVDAEISFRNYSHISYTGISGTLPLYKTAFLTSKDDAHVVSAVKALNELGQHPAYKCWSFGTDGALVATEYGIPTIGYSPCEEEYAHTPIDRVNLDLMKKAFIGYTAISIAVSE